MPSKQQHETMSDSAKQKEDWMNTRWRPMMGWMYMAVCIADFVIFPILWSLIQVHGNGRVEAQWSPLTLQGAGLFHLAMGAILGIAVYGRTQEKLNDKNNGFMPNFGSSRENFDYTPTQGFGNAPLGGNTMSTTPRYRSRPDTSNGPVQPPHPEI